MSWWDSFLGLIGFPAGAQDGDNVRTNKITTERYSDGQAGTERLAMGLSATWACVNFWAGNIASLPVTIYRKGPMGIAVEATDHPLFWLLHDSPNYDQSAYDFWEYMCACLELHGNAYAEIEKREDGFIVSLTPVRPDIMGVRRVASGEIEYKWSIDGSERTVPQDRMLHIRGFGGGPLGGLSPLQVCRSSFGSAVAAESAAAATFRNGIRSTGVVSPEGAKPLTAEQVEQTQKMIEEKYAGAMNAGRPLFLNGLKWQALSLSPDDAQMLETRQFGVEDICRIFEVDPHMVGHTAGNTQLGSSITDQTLSLLKFKLRKRLKRIEGSLEKQLLTRAERKSGLSIEFNLEALLRADSLGRAQFYEIMKQFMTKNEIRALEGLAPVDGGDVMFTQMQDVPLAEAIKGTTETAA